MPALVRVYLLETIMWVVWPQPPPAAAPAAGEPHPIAERVARFAHGTPADDFATLSLLHLLCQKSREAAYTANPLLIPPEQLYVSVPGGDPLILQPQWRRPAAADRALLDKYDHMSAAQCRMFAPPAAGSGLAVADIEALILTTEATIPIEYHATLAALRAGRKLRMASPDFPTPEGVFFCAYGGQHAKPSLAEQEAWRTIKPEEARGRCIDTLETFTSRFMITRALHAGVTECTDLQILNRYVQGLSRINPILGRRVHHYLTDQPEAHRTLDLARRKAAELSAAEEALPAPSPAAPTAAAAAAAPAHAPAVPANPPPSRGVNNPARSHLAAELCNVCDGAHAASRCYVLHPNAAPDWWHHHIRDPGLYALFKLQHSRTNCQRPLESFGPAPLSGDERNASYNQQPPPSSYAPQSHFNFADAAPATCSATWSLCTPYEPSSPTLFEAPAADNPVLATTRSMTHGLQPQPQSLHPVPSASTSTAPIPARPPLSPNKRVPPAAAPAQAAPSPAVAAPAQIPASAPPIPFRPTPIPLDTPISQLPTRMQQARTRAPVTPSFDPASIAYTPELLPVPVQYFINAGPGILESLYTAGRKCVPNSTSTDFADLLLLVTFEEIQAAMRPANAAPVRALLPSPADPSPTPSHALSSLPDPTPTPSQPNSPTSHAASIPPIRSTAAAVVETAAERQDYPVIHTLQGGPALTTLSVVHSATGTILPYRTAIYDSGSTLNMADRAWVDEHGLSIDSSKRTVLHTSDGHSTTTLGTVSTPLHFTFCKGHPQYDRSVQLELHVVPCSTHVYDILLGVPFINGCATWVDVPTSELVYRPDYMTQGDTVTMHRIPITTTMRAPVKE